MTRIGTRLALCIGLSAILWGCAPPPPDPMTVDYAVRVRQDGPRRIREFFEKNPADPNWISIRYLSTVNGGHTKRWWHVPDSRTDRDTAFLKKLLEDLRDHLEPIRETLPAYGAFGVFPEGSVLVTGRNSAMEITVEDSGAHVGDVTGLFVNKPFFNALEQYLVREGILDRGKYHWHSIARFRMASGELSLNAYLAGIPTEEDLKEAIKRWPPGSLDDPDPEFGAPKPNTSEE